MKDEGLEWGREQGEHWVEIKKKGKGLYDKSFLLGCNFMKDGCWVVVYQRHVCSWVCVKTTKGRHAKTKRNEATYTSK